MPSATLRTQLPNGKANWHRKSPKTTTTLALLLYPRNIRKMNWKKPCYSEYLPFPLGVGYGICFCGRQETRCGREEPPHRPAVLPHPAQGLYIRLELKAVSFEPEFVGKLNFYVNAIDKLKKTENDSPDHRLAISAIWMRQEVQWSCRGRNYSHWCGFVIAM